MKKIDVTLLNYVIMSESKCQIEGLVYYNDKPRLNEFLNENNIKVVKELPFLSAFVVCFMSEQLLKLSQQNFVTYISSLASAKTLVDVSKKILGVSNSEFNGEGQTVAIIDTGINPHLDFMLGSNRIVKFCDFINHLDMPYDDNGHGTYVAGVLAGSGKVSGGKFSGIAPRANIVSLKALNEKGEANAVTILDAMQWIFDNHKQYNITTVCMSFGSEPLGSFDPIMKGAEKLWQDGLTVVCAAGNSGPSFQTIKSPGVSRKIITVGGLDDKRNEFGEYEYSNFEVAEFSSRGPANNRIKPDVIAPSVNITSCSYMGGYTAMSGTSVATPMVAGLAVILKERYPSATPEQIKNYLIKNAVDIRGNRYSQGYGIAHLLNI